MAQPLRHKTRGRDAAPPQLDRSAANFSLPGLRSLVSLINKFGGSRDVCGLLQATSRKPAAAK